MTNLDDAATASGRQASFFSMRNIVFAFLVFAFSILAAAQDEEEVIFSDAVMEQIVRRVVSRNFKPSRRPRTVYFGE